MIKIAEYELNGYNIISDLEFKLEENPRYKKLYNERIEFGIANDGSHYCYATEEGHGGWAVLDKPFFDAFSVRKITKGSLRFSSNKSDREYSIEYEGKTKTFRISIGKK